MNRACLLATIAAVPLCARAQLSTATSVVLPDGSTRQTAPLPAHEDVLLTKDGRCQSVHPGDTATFTLRIEAVEGARAVFSSLQLDRDGERRAHLRETDLPLFDGDAIHGGGLGTRDQRDAKLYRFHLTVPDVPTGIYHADGIEVRASYFEQSKQQGVSVALSRSASNEVHHYCLAVFNPGEHRPLVTQFKPSPARPGTETVELFH